MCIIKILRFSDSCLSGHGLGLGGSMRAAKSGGDYEFCLPGGCIDF